MDSREVFKKYRAKLEREGIITSIVCSLAIGFVVVFALAFTFWMKEIKGLWICAVAGIAVTAAFTPLFYFKKFRPDTKEIARRLDNQGLDERMITMTELSAEDSYIAKLQREDAAVSLKKNEEDGKKIRFRLAGGKKCGKAIALTTGTTGVIGIAMSVILGLTIMGTLPSGNKLVHGEEQPVRYMVSYMEGDGYMIVGEADQIVEEGGKTSEITAVAVEEGWAFVQWSDMQPDDPNNIPTRHEENVTEDKVVFAIFMEVDSSGGGGGDGEPEDSDKPKDPPPDGGGGGSSDPSDGDPGKGGSQGNTNMRSDVINENYESVDYREIYQKYYDQIKQELASGNLTPEQRAFYEKYFETLK